MRICIDLDGVISQLKLEGQSYSNVKPNMDVIKRIREFKKQGHTIIIYTARNMKTCAGNVGKVLANIGKETLNWLNKYKVPFDEIYFGKPYADIYIDDNALRFNNISDLDYLPYSKEFVAKNIKFKFIITMAGKGIRFIQQGYKLPKYMIKLRNQHTIFYMALKSLPLNIANELIFIILEEHIKKFNVINFLEKECRKLKIENKSKFVTIKKHTKGQAETVIKAIKYIRNDDNISIYNIDTHFFSKSLEGKLLSYQYDGVVSGFFLDRLDTKWSFAKVKSNMIIEKVAEKNQISNIALTGFYNFTRAIDYIDGYELLLKRKIFINNELYIAPIYNLLIEKGKRYVIDMVEYFIPLGTPEDVKIFNKSYKG